MGGLPFELTIITIDIETLTGLTPLLDPLLIVMQAWADYLDRLKNGEK